jgi:GLPGLI family protein
MPFQSIGQAKESLGTNFVFIVLIEWHLSNENRIIAGYNCRKAVGKIMDSVYVFAFYSDEITIPGGPCSVNGLPGTILGLTIPRMYTSWIATKIEIEKADEAAIVPVKAKKYYTTKGLQANLKERTKEWFRDDDPDSKKWIEQFYWNTSL